MSKSGAVPLPVELMICNLSSVLDWNSCEGERNSNWLRYWLYQNLTQTNAYENTFHSSLSLYCIYNILYIYICMHVCMNCKISYAQYMSWIDPDTVVALVVSGIWLSEQPTQAGAPLKKKGEFINQSSSSTAQGGGSNLSLLSASSLLCFSSVHIVGSLTSKLPSNIYI